MTDDKSGRIRPLTEDDLELLLTWRNDSDVRRHMFNAGIISLEEHRQWFQRAAEARDRDLLLFEAAGKPRGFVQFSHPAGNPVATWGFYAAPGSPPRTGTQLGHSALDHAFERLKLHKVFGQVLATNERSVRLHRSLGFREEGLLRDQHFNGKHYQDVICFGLFEAEWKTAH